MKEREGQQGQDPTGTERKMTGPRRRRTVKGMGVIKGIGHEVWSS